MKHVDEWIDEPNMVKPENRGLRYAKWFLLIKRMPVWMQIAFKEFHGDMKLFCMYKGEKYRCTGASRFGDIYLTEDFNRERGYELRVDLTECSDWSDQ
jgi:hypothetical protein